MRIAVPSLEEFPNTVAIGIAAAVPAIHTGFDHFIIVQRETDRADEGGRVGADRIGFGPGATVIMATVMLARTGRGLGAIGRSLGQGGALLRRFAQIDYMYAKV